MCGITGFCNPKRTEGKAELEQLALRMATALRHRGPDDCGAWADVESGVALGHRRLAILDLSQQGHQPMLSIDGRYSLVFNGEIYNFRALRKELRERGYTFRSQSDTEVMLSAFSEWGIRSALGRCNGMFAVAVWDRRERCLHLARDRAGEKPLYYGWTGDVFMFGSELKALQAHPNWKASIDRRGVALLMRYGYIPAPLSIYENIFKLTPGCTLTLTERQLQSRKSVEPEPYWSLQTVVRKGTDGMFSGTDAEATEQLQALLFDSVRLQMVSDVPLGAFLSGGIDSSLVVAAMQAQSSRPIKTFTIGFHHGVLDEAPFAKAVSHHLGTDHTELYVEPSDLLEAISRLPKAFDEPFGDPSQIPTLLLCELARTKVTVSLSGDAGDELFAGYEGYRKLQRLLPLIRHIPSKLRAGLARFLERSAGSTLTPQFAARSGRYLLGRLANLSDVLPTHNDLSLYRLLMSPNRKPLEWLKYKEEPPTRFDDLSAWEALPDLLHRMMYLDFISYLPDDILVKVDRAAMSVGLETRVPFLDHRIIEFAWSLPNSMKQRRGRGKWLLRQVLHKFVPTALVERPKQGFAVPISDWLRGPLRPWAEELLAQPRLRREGFFDEQTVAKKWSAHVSGIRDFGAGLWHVLMFQSWLEQQDAPFQHVDCAPIAGAVLPSGVDVCPQ